MDARVDLTDGPGVVQHGLANTFTAMIPKEWIKPGLDVTINAGGQQVTHTDLSIGAPNKMVHLLASLRLFSNTGGGSGGSPAASYPSGWNAEWAQKMPFAELEVRDGPYIHLEQVLIPPNAGHPAYWVGSSAEYKAITGISPKIGRENYTKFVGHTQALAGGRDRRIYTQFPGEATA